MIINYQQLLISFDDLGDRFKRSMGWHVKEKAMIDEKKKKNAEIIRYSDINLVQREIEQNGIRVDQTYRHYKGGLYIIVFLSTSEGDNFEPLVSYRLKSDANSMIWTRTLSNFVEIVSIPSNLTGAAAPRFRRIS